VRTELGGRIRERRAQLGLSQHALAARAGLSGKFIGEVERGQKSISVDSLHNVAAGLGVSVAQLVSRGETAPRTSTNLVDRIIVLLRGRRKAQLRRALALLEVLFVSP
jgi:transcriptional regulator with XRE-family HTH domain